MCDNGHCFFVAWTLTFRKIDKTAGYASAIVHDMGDIDSYRLPSRRKHFSGYPGNWIPRSLGRLYSQSAVPNISLA